MKIFQDWFKTKQSAKDVAVSCIAPAKNERGVVDAVFGQRTVEGIASKTDPTQRSMDEILKRVTRVRVVPVTNYLRETAITFLDISDEASLTSFRLCFAIVEDPKTFGHCMCNGDPHFELYAGNRLIASLGYHHGVAIRWNSWKYDAWFKEPERLLDWLSSCGVDGPRREFDDRIRRGEEQTRHAELWLAAMPGCLRPFWMQMDYNTSPELIQKFLAVFQNAIPLPEKQILTLFAWFGSGVGPWSGFPAYEAIPEKLLFHYPTQVLVDVLTLSAPTETQWLGAARYFGSWDFGQTKKADRALIPLDLRQILLQSARATGIQDVIERAERAFK